MKYMIKRTENFEGNIHIKYMQESGFFGNKETARLFDTQEDAEWMIEVEQSDTVYDKAFMGECTFEVEVVNND